MGSGATANCAVLADGRTLEPLQRCSNLGRLGRVEGHPHLIMPRNRLPRRPTMLESLAMPSVTHWSRASILGVRAQVDAAALRQGRIERGLTQAELANVLGVAGGERVSAWERGVNQPDVRLVPVLASALGVEPAALLGRPQSGLRELRWTAGLTARELGAALHVSRNTYLRYESGERSIPRHALAVPRLAAALGVSEQVVTAALRRSSSTTLVDQVQQELTGSWTRERGDGGDLPDDGIPGLASKLNYLFATVPRAVNTSQLHTNETAAMALEKCGIGVTKTHLSHLRAGRRDNPSAKLLAGLARLFGVPIAYFFDEEREREVNQQLATLVAMRDTRVRNLMMRAHGVSQESLGQIEGILDQIRRLEGLEVADEADSPPQ